MLNEYDHLLNKYRNRFFEERLGSIGLSGPPGFYLRKIAMTAPVKMNVIVDEAPFHKSHATRAIMRLSEGGFVEKDIDPDDQRCFILKVTRTGSDAAEKIDKVLYDWDELLSSALDEGERLQLVELTKKMYLRVKSYFNEETER